MRKIIFLISLLASLIGFAQGGSLDTSFNVQGMVSPETILKFQPADGKIILVERFVGKNGVVESSLIRRLDPDGNVDLNFAGGIGTTILSDVKTVAFQSDGKIIVGGNLFRVNNDQVLNLVRLDPDGSLDESFSKITHTGITTVLIQPDDKIIIGGSFPKGIVRFYANGQIDPFFNSEIDINSREGGTVSNMILDSEGRVLAVGNVRIAGERKRVFRLNSAGELDPDFEEPANIDFSYGDPWNPKVLITDKNNGNILIGWPFRVYADFDTTIGYNFVRLAPNGDLIDVLQPYPFADSCVLNVYPAALQDDGKIIMRGVVCQNYYGFPFNGIARLNNDGSWDDTFDVGTGANSYVSNVVVQPDGKIILTGFFTEYNGFRVNNIIRLTTESLSSADFDNSIMRVYPNPVADNLYISFPYDITDADITELEIYDVTMKKMEFDDMNEDVIDVSGFASGVYLLKVKTEDSIFTSRFVKD